MSEEESDPDRAEPVDVERYRDDARLAARATPEDRRRYVASLREQAAMLLGMADSMDKNAREFPGLHEQAMRLTEAVGVDMSGYGELGRMFAEGGQHARLAGEVQAAQAVAYQDMLDAGGPENVEAYARYAEACRRHTALLPTDDTPHEDVSGYGERPW